MITASAYSRKTDFGRGTGAILFFGSTSFSSSALFRTVPFSSECQCRTDNRQLTSDHFRTFPGCRLSVSHLKLALLFSHRQQCHERFLGYLHAADLFHASLACRLLRQELSLPRDVAPVALGSHGLPEGGDSLPRDHPTADGRLNHHLEELTRDQLPHPLRQEAAARGGLVPVDDEGQSVHRFAVDQDVQLDQGALSVVQEIV